MSLLLVSVLLLCLSPDVPANGAGPAGREKQPAAISSQANLIPNPHFAPGPPASASAETAQLPSGWSIGAGGRLRDSRFWLPARKDPADNAIGITGGQDRQGRWNVVLPRCKPGARYRFEADFYRPGPSDPDVYPEVSIWGRTFRLDTLRMVGRFQRLHAEMTCPASGSPRDRFFSFIDRHPGVSFWMRNPSLVRQKNRHFVPQVPAKIDYYPIGAYGADAENLRLIKEIGMNSAVIGLSERNVSACLEYALHCSFAVPRDPKQLTAALDRLGLLLHKGAFSFYVNDEPGIHSFPAGAAATIQHILKRRFPKSFTAMAIVRPQVIPDYQDGADYFMLDQYPIPHVPMIWLSESMDAAAGFVGRRRLQSVIQAFGGPRYAKDGWPRLPTFAEMNCLVFLSIIHGSRGVYFFSWPEITSTPEGKKDLGRVVHRLNSLQSWLARYNDRGRLGLKMISRYGYDPSGHPAVQCASKRQQGTRLLLCVNTIRTPVEAAVDIPWKHDDTWRDFYSGERYYTVRRTVILRFAPLEAKVLLETR